MGVSSGISNVFPTRPLMIRCRTLWPHVVGGLSFRSSAGGHWRRNGSGTHWRGEGGVPGKRGHYWPAGPDRDLHIAWWREKLARRRADDKACRARIV
jgi:hypothetical protein